MPTDLEILHVLSGESLHAPELRGRIDRDKLNLWLTGNLQPDHVDEWFICGPMEMTTAVRESLLEHRVDSERIHLELFHGFEPVLPQSTPTRARRLRSSCPASSGRTI